MLRLPDDILEIILTQLPALYIIHASTTCKRIIRIITASMPIQLRLHQHLYQDSDPDLQGPDKSHPSRTAKDQLANLIRRQSPFDNLRCTRFKWPDDIAGQIISAYDGYIAIEIWHEDGRLEVDEGGTTTLFILMKVPCSGNDINEASQKKITFSRTSDTLIDTIVDLAKNLVMVREHLAIREHVKLHILKVSDEGDSHQLEYQGAGVLDLGICFEEDEDHNLSGRGPDVYCLIDEVFIVSRGYVVKFYNWMNGNHLHTLRLPYSISKSHSVSWIEPGLVAVEANVEAPLYPERETARHLYKLKYLLIYQTKDLLTTTRNVPTAPILVLSFPTALSDLPACIRDEIPPPQEHPHRFKYIGPRQIKSAKLEVLRFDLTLIRYLNLDSYPSVKRYDISMYIPPHMLMRMVNDAIGRQSPRSDADHESTINSLEIPIVTLVLEPCHWWKYSFWTFDHTLPCDIGKRDRRSRALTDEGDIRQSCFAILDFNPRILRTHPPSGKALLGLGEALPIHGFVPESKVRLTMFFEAKNPIKTDQ
ncbi:uncharacterized protein L199_006793 [Kwoniella botswanensis]|uniref:uncharacterized protein n=1 Tax=Kwoniella botswanensis TaxID=1268659 RepID=UPI00315C654F